MRREWRYLFCDALHFPSVLSNCKICSPYSMFQKRKSDPQNIKWTRKSRKDTILEMNNEVWRILELWWKRMTSRPRLNYRIYIWVQFWWIKKHLKSDRWMQSVVIRKCDGLNPEAEKLLIAWKITTRLESICLRTKWRFRWRQFLSLKCLRAGAVRHKRKKFLGRAKDSLITSRRELAGIILGLRRNLQVLTRDILKKI